jgi:hypothetical protein
VTANGPDLAQLQQLCDAATPGPWTAITDNRRKTGIGIVGATADRGTGQAIAVFASTNGHRNADAQLTAAARTALPDLIALAAELRQQKASLQRAHNAVLNLHRRYRGVADVDSCEECSRVSSEHRPYPCDTRIAIDAEETANAQ